MCDALQQKNVSLILHSIRRLLFIRIGVVLNAIINCIKEYVRFRESSIMTLLCRLIEILLGQLRYLIHFIKDSGIKKSIKICNSNFIGMSLLTFSRISYLRSICTRVTLTNQRSDGEMKAYVNIANLIVFMRESRILIPLTDLTMHL